MRHSGKLIKPKEEVSGTATYTQSVKGTGNNLDLRLASEGAGRDSPAGLRLLPLGLTQIPGRQRWNCIKSVGCPGGVGESLGGMGKITHANTQE